MFGDSQFTSTLSVNFHFPKIPRRTFLYMGNPVKQARPLKPAEIAFLKTSADNYVLLKDEYLQEA